MDALLAPLLLIVGAALGGGIAWWLRGREVASERQRATTAEIAAADARATVMAEQRGHEREVAALTELRVEIETKMQALAADALQKNQTSFLNLANEVFSKHREGAARNLDEGQQAIAALLAPLATTLEEYRKSAAAIENARVAQYSGLATEIQGLVRVQEDASAQTRKLVTALRAAPKTRGRWGEQQLHNVLELSGMTPFIDFTVEGTIDLDDSRLRPDVVICLPGDRKIVVDAKTSMAAYLEAVEASEDEVRETHLKAHARQLRTHMRQLAAKAYWDALPFNPDFVVMFIPGENFFAAAIERDPQLFEDAIAARVLIVTPTTLIALAKAIAFGWRQEKIADTAKQVAELGRELYRRLAAMGGHIVKLGAGLEGAVKHYNDFVGSLESRVMPSARRFNELKVEGAHDPLPELKPVETQTRLLRSAEPSADAA
ncbi:MAG TPA: DNA recombination protein RmuC [Stellaceae bacterium]|jgi:DNA recombination protein RmuC